MTDESHLYTLARDPRPLRLLRALWRPSERFVMVNLLSFRDAAEGPGFAGKTGEEAYQAYGRTVVKVQAALGSRLRFVGRVDRIAGQPPFDSVALLEYASPWSFVRFAADRRTDHRARAAGLAGQWLFSATTLRDDSASRPPGGFALLELFGDDAAPPPSGGVLLWRGRADVQVLGTSDPPIRSVDLTWFPTEAERDRVADQPRGAVVRVRVTPGEVPEALR